MAKFGPKRGDSSARAAGRQGGKSRPSLKKSSHKQGARHGKPKAK